MHNVLYLLFAIITLNRTHTSSADIPSHWVQPDAWSRSNLQKNDQPFDCSKCPQEDCNTQFSITHHKHIENDFTCLDQNTNNNDEHGQFLYKKLANYLLDRKQIKWDNEKSQYYRKFHLIISTDQYNRLDGLSNSQDIDAILSEILYQSKSSALDTVKDRLRLWWDTILYSYNSKVFWPIIQFFSFIALWLASRWYKFNFFIVFGIFLLYLVYVAVDAECNRKIDIERMAILMEKEHIGDPCDIKNYGFFKYYFGNPKAECRDYLKKNYNSRDTCSVIEIYEEFINIFVYNSISTFMSNIAKMIGTIYADYGIILTIIMSLIFVFVLYHFGITFITGFFKYFLHSFMGHIFHRSSAKPSNSSNSPSINENYDAVNKLIDLAINQHACLSETILKQSKNEFELKKLSIEEKPLNTDLNCSSRKQQIFDLQLQIQNTHKVISKSTNTKIKKANDFSRDGILRVLDSLHSQEVMCSDTKRLAQLYIRLLFLQGYEQQDNTNSTLVNQKDALNKCSSVETIDLPSETSEILADILYTCEEMDKTKQTSIEFSSESKSFDDKIENLHSSSTSELKQSVSDTSDENYVIL